MATKSSVRYLWAYSAADEWTVAWHERLRKRRRERGFDVEHFCVTPPALKRRWLQFPELDRLWRIGHPALMQMYEQLALLLEDRDVLILYNGANLHPEFVKGLKVIKVYTSGDPESNDVLARPLAPSFDIHLVNQAPSIKTFRDWGLKHVYFWPLGSLSAEEDVSDLDEDVISDISRRPLPIACFAEQSQYRRQKLDMLADAFPNALCAGRGWPRGFVDWPEMWSAYRRAQIGWNVHNSTGFNFRTYDLAALGVMQICDNKSDLQDIFELGREAVGFDTIDECIDLTRYYLAHPEEQRQIAVAGWKRWKREHTPDRVWDKLVSIVEAHRAEFSDGPRHSLPVITSELRRRSSRLRFQRLVSTIQIVSGKIWRRSRRILLSR